MNLESFLQQELQYLQQEHKKRMTAGYFARKFYTYRYQKERAMFEDFLRETWQWDMLRKMRDTISDKLFVGEKAATTSNIFLKQTSVVEDYGGFAVREPFGEASFSHIATFSEHVTNSETRYGNKSLLQDEKGILLYFPNVYKSPGVEALVLHTNKLTDENEIRAGLGIPQRRQSMLQQFANNLIKEVQGNGNRLEVPEGPFARRFREHFEIECKDAAFAGYVITDDFMERVLTLRKVIGKGISISYVGADIYFFVHGCDAFIRGWCGEKKAGIDEDSVKLMDMLLNHTSDLLELLLPKEGE